MFKRTDPGERRHLVTFQELTYSSPPEYDAAGQRAATWEPVLTTWAKITGVRAADVIKYGQDVAQAYLIVNVRYRAEINPRLRLVANNGTYTIQAISNLEERNEELDLSCQALGLNQ